MRRIPQCKVWLVTDENGQRFEIWAPTRRLALLNFRFEIGWQAIRTIGVKRQRAVNN